MMPTKMLQRHRRTEIGIDAASLLILLALIFVASLKFIPVPTSPDLDLPSFYGHGRMASR